VTMIGTDPTVIAVTKIDRAARALRATSVDHDDVLRRLVAIAPDHVVAAIGSLERSRRRPHRRPAARRDVGRAAVNRWDDFRARPGAAAVIVTAVASLVLLVGSLVGVPAVTRHDALTIDAPVYATSAPVPAEVPSASSPSMLQVTPTSPPDVTTAGTSADPLEYAEVADEALVARSAPIPGTTLPITRPPAGDCTAWADVFRHYGATELEVQFFFGNARPWGVPRTNIIGSESDCGRDFINENTSDRYVCQLNGVHSEAGYSFGTYYGPGGWMLELFGLRGGRAVTTQAEASTLDAVPACLWLLRGGFTPDAFDGVNHWQPV